MLGAVEFVTKPFAPEFLLDTVNRILGNDEEHTPPQKPNAS
jgi:FixJ family two-component response regulator